MDRYQTQRNTSRARSGSEVSQSDVFEPDGRGPKASEAKFGSTGEAPGVSKDHGKKVPRNKKVSIVLQHEDALGNLKETLQRFKTFRGELEKRYKNTVDHVNELYKILGIDDAVSKWLKDRMDEDMRAVKGFITKDPVIIVSGTVNSGKSSLVNEILERNCVPVDKTPFTAMLTRLFYSPHDYYQLFNPDGSTMTEKLEFHAEKLREHLELEYKSRETDAVKCTVEVGLNNPILDYGIQIIDTPGTNENELLDAVVQQAVDGVLQVLIYVIDGCRSLTRIDQDFIEMVTTKYPELNILYVCNKCEESRSAKKNDAFSDDEEDGVKVEQKQQQRKLSKGEEVFQRLLGMKNVELGEKNYFQISCSVLRKARQANKRRRSSSSETFMQEFSKLINALISKFDECVYGCLQDSVASLYALATSVFDYFVSVKFLNQPMWESLHRKLMDVIEIEKQAFEDLRALIDGQCQQMNDSLKRSIKARKDYIVSSVHRRVFQTPLENLDGVALNDEQKENLAVLFQRVMYEEIVQDHDFQESRDYTQKAVISKIQTLIDECEKLPGVGDLVPQLKSCFKFELLSNGARFCQTMYKKSLSLTLRAILVKILKKVAPGSNEKRRENLRQAVIRRFVECVDEKELGLEVARELYIQLFHSHKRFKSVVETIEKAHELRKAKQSELMMKFFPLFSKEICDLRVLRTEVDELHKPLSGSFHRLVDTKSGHRNENMIFGNPPRQLVQRRIKTEGVRYEEDSNDLTILLNCGRMLGINHDNILTSFDLKRGDDGRLWVTLPYCQSNLFYGLYHSMKIPMECRMLMATKILDACVYLSERGFRANDLRPNNILLRQWEPMLDLCKWKSLTTPYPKPDDRPPFHFAPEALRDDQDKGGDYEQPGTFDTYSSVILIWLLGLGKFVRPPFAQTNSVEEVQHVILNDTLRVKQELLQECQKYWDEPAKMKVMKAIGNLVERNIILEGDKRMTIQELSESMKDLHHRCNLVTVRTSVMTM